MKVLLSLKPTYAEQILAGTKKFEFRRRIFRDTSTVAVVMYVTKPVGKVVGEFTIKKIHEGHPDELWSLASRHAGISHSGYLEYFQGRQEGFAIEISKVSAYSQSRDLTEVLASGKPPQSFAYLPGGAGATIRSRSQYPGAEVVPASSQLKARSRFAADLMA